MAKEWGPSWLGQHLTGSSDWRLRLEGMELVLTLDGRTHRANVEETATYRVQAGTFWTDITLKQFEGREVKADGLPNTQGAALSHAVEVALADKHLRDDIAFLESERRPIERWLTLMASEEERCAQQRRWFTHEEQAAVIAARPIIDVQGMRARLKKPGVQMRLGPTAREIERAMASWEETIGKPGRHSTLPTWNANWWPAKTCWTGWRANRSPRNRQGPWCASTTACRWWPQPARARPPRWWPRRLTPSTAGS